jgi:hypothetical protein
MGQLQAIYEEAMATLGEAQGVQRRYASKKKEGMTNSKWTAKCY